MIKHYSNGEIIIEWDPTKCIHSACCVRNSPEVFKPMERPWISIENAETEEIVTTIKKCPSGALSYKWEEKVSK
ncbi:hypothetical protein FACS1894153_2130 [Bacteroidia bacterium]|nr:hypothetical protein FACS1894153_2130 [Bacteroidia bacterium]